MLFASLILHILPKLSSNSTPFFSVYFFSCFNSPFKSFLASESLASRNTSVYPLERLNASTSSTSRTDTVVLASSRQSFATHSTTCHANSQSRRSSASISPVEELFERIQYYSKNSSLCHSETLSKLGVANVATADDTTIVQIFHLSPEKENSTGLLLRSFLNRYYFSVNFISVLNNLENSCLSFLSLTCSARSFI